LATASMTTQCKCHGVSGSCSMKTCWRALADMPSLAQRIHQNYELAVEVRSRRVPGSTHRRLLPAKHTGRTNFSDDDLLFYTQSPDYCHPEPSLGSVGTTNRCESVPYEHESVNSYNCSNTTVLGLLLDNDNIIMSSIQKEKY